jgi:hypothetical protein
MHSITSLQIVLTTAMFNWADTEKSTLVKLPFEIWMGFTGSVIVLLIIGLALMGVMGLSKKADLNTCHSSGKLFE